MMQLQSIIDCSAPVEPLWMRRIDRLAVDPHSLVPAFAHY
jgi:hypothetical protein